MKTSDRRVLRVLALVVVVALALTSAVMAQGIRLDGVAGGSLTDADLGRGTTVVVFFATWSPRGRNLGERIQAVTRSAGGKATVVAVNYQEDRATVAEFLAGTALGVPVFLDIDGALAKKYKMANLPGLLVLKNGTAAFQGRLPDDPAAVLTPILQ